MPSDYIILGDWGTSSLTLSLGRFDSGGFQAAEALSGQGVKFCGDPAAHFHQLTAAWRERHGPLPVILAGMVGSALGWKDTGYVTCPLSVEKLRDATTRFDSLGHPVSIICGVKCSNPFGNSDVMRGEETQILGWAARNRDIAAPRLLCLPGTHTKWAYMENRVLQNFLTVPRGEMHQILMQHGIFLDKRDMTGAGLDLAIFKETVERVRRRPELDLMSTLFSVRSRLVLGELSPLQAFSYFSGLLIGFDLRAALRAYEKHIADDAPVSIIGSAANAGLYAAALDIFGRGSDIYASTQATIDGMVALLHQDDKESLSHAFS